MFKEILMLVPKLSGSDLNNMERSLSSRFARVAKKFGKGLGASLLGGGVAGAALGLIDKLLNPLQATQEAIDRTLAKSDDIVTNAKQFNTTSGKLARLQAIGEASGLDAGSLNVLITKFQTAVAEAKVDPKKNTSVRNFVGDTDTAESFFQFIQALEKMDSTQKTLIQQEVFGEKQILKMADFLQSAGQIGRTLKGPSSEQLTGVLNKGADLNDLKDKLGAERGLEDIFKKNQLINASMIKAQDERIRKDIEKENQNIQAYANLDTLAKTVTEMLSIVTKISLAITDAFTKFFKILPVLEGLSKSTAFKTILKFIKAE